MNDRPSRRRPIGRPHRTERLFALARAAKGFMPDDEGEALFGAAVPRREHLRGAERRSTFVEVGAWCGKSAVYLGAAAEATGAALFSLDHHHGSEENQAGWDHHDTEVVDPESGRMDTLPFFRRTIDTAPGSGEHCGRGRRPTRR